METGTINVSGYHRIYQLYEGSKSTVYRAIRDFDNAPVIVKLRPQPKHVDVREHPLWNEAAVLEAIDSGYVPQLCELKETDDELALIYEDIGGDPLVSLDAKTPLGLMERLNLAYMLVLALEEIHAAGFVHRDINPSNIIWNQKTGRLQIIDYGLAATLKQLNQMPVLDSTFQGTLTYLAPEQTGRINRRVDHRADLYSLGATLYELFTDKPPFLADSDLELVHAHIAKAPKPPSEIESFVPDVVSDMVLKLLSKAAEDRYQTAAGVAHDLYRCIEQLQEVGSCAPFELGSGDVPAGLFFPDKVYGRDKELDEINQAFSRALTGSAELVLVSGYSGVGKTALCDVFGAQARKSGGIFVSGKFDQLQGEVPYSAFKAALRDLVRQTLKEDERHLAARRKQLLDTVGPNAQVLIDFLPELELVLGAQQPVANLEPNEAQNRFNEVVKRLLRAYSQPAQPLVVFLDDVQWMDPATLRLFKAIMSDSDMGYLMILAAFRSNETDGAHVLTQGISWFSDSDVSLTHLELKTLDLGSLTELLSETLGIDSADIRDLATVILRKTDGNSFFIKEFVSAVYEQGSVEFDPATHGWRWDIEGIEKMRITDNVADLLNTRIGALPKTTIEILSIAACMGASFNVKVVASVGNQTEDAVIQELAPALIERFVYEQLAEFTPDGKSGEGRRFSFSHDRIQHSIYESIPEAERTRIHVAIGNTLLSESPGAQGGEFSFDAVDHLNRGLDVLVDESERIRLASLNLEAGIKAKNAAAYKAAKAFLGTALELTVEPPDDTNLMFSLYSENAEVAHLNAEFRESKSFIKNALSQTDSVIEKTKLQDLVVVQQTLQGSYQDAIDVAREALASLGISLPDGDYEAAYNRELDSARHVNVERDRAKLLDMPAMSDPSIIVAMRMLMNLFPPTLFINPTLNNWVAVKMVNLSMEHGYAPETPKAFTNFGVVLAVGGDYQAGYEFGSLALQMIDTRGPDEMRPRVLFAFLADLNHWTKPLRTTRELIDDAYITSIEFGELPYAGYLLTFARCMNEVFLGDNLQRFKSKTQDAIEFVRKTKNTHAESVALAAHLAIKNLLGETDNYNLFDTNEITESEFIRESEARNDFAAICFLRILQAQNLYFFGHFREAFTAILTAQRLSSYLSPGMPRAMLNLYSSLIYAATEDLEPSDTLEKIRENQEIMKSWSDDCPDNFMHCFHLVEGEIARNLGAEINTVNHYSEAASWAKKNGFKQFEALAHELSARFWRERGNSDYARRHINKAYRYYFQWGAARKLQLMQETYADILTVTEDENDEYLRSPHTISNESTNNSQKLLDIEALSSASQSISREIKFQALLNSLAKTIIEVAGAEKYVLLLIDEMSGKLTVRSSHDLSRDDVTQSQAEPEQVTPISLIRYVLNTAETVLIDDAAKDSLYKNDPYILENSPKSILSVPIKYQGKLLGVLYLENNSATGSFTAQSLGTLEILSTQAAISIHNAALYESLEDKVEDRTRKLDRLNRELEERVHSQVDQIEKLNRLRRFLSPQVSELIVSKGDESLLASHRKKIAIIFCDLRGFTAFSESVEPEEAVDMLSEYHQTIGDLITKYQATIDHRAGDGMMIFLNDPIPHDDPIKEAVSLAIELREMVNRQLKKWESYGHSLGFGIGISYGTATIGMIGYEGSYDYAATGRNVNLASRLCDEALHNQILITQRIQAELPDNVRTEFVAELELKGISSKVPAFNVMLDRGG